MCAPSFYKAHALQEPLTWRQSVHNVGAQLLYFPFFHQHYDVIDAKTLERSRITSTLNAATLLEIAVKVLLAATLVIPIICIAISRPTASERSWQQIDTLFGQLEDEEKKDFLYDFLTNKGIEEDSPFADLYRIADSYLESHLEADLLSRLICLDPLIFEEVKYWNDGRELLYAAADSYVHQRNPQITVLYPFLAAADQIRILQQLQNREKDLLRLFPLSKTAALECPGQLLQCLIPRELRPANYGIVLQGLPELFHTAEDLQRSIPKAYQAIEALSTTLPQGSVLGVFWKIAKSIRPSIWGERRIVTVDALSQEEKRAIQALPFEEVLILYQFEQPWTALWYLVGQTPEKLRQACFSLPHDNENSFRQQDNRENFLDLLSHEDLKHLIIEDPDCVELSRIFGNERIYSTVYSMKKAKSREWIEIPQILLRWWHLYAKVDYLQRMEELSTFCANEALLQYFQDEHESYLKNKPMVDEAIRRWNEHMALAKEWIAEEIEGRRRGNLHAADFGRWKRAREEAARAKAEAEQARKLEEQTLNEELKAALEWLGLDPRRAYTQEEFLREFRRWSLKYHPDKDRTEGANVRYQQGSAYKNRVIEIFEARGYSKTPVFR